MSTMSDHQAQLGALNWNYTICAGATNHSRSFLSVSVIGLNLHYSNC